jgi:hypothetical protein
MRQSFRFVFKQEGDVTGGGLLFEQLQSNSRPFDRIHLLPRLERVPRPTPPKPPFLTITTRSDDSEITWPVLASTSSRIRGTVQTTPGGAGRAKISSTTASTVAANRAGGP